MEKCFVIQPFDNGKFDKRYSDIFRPAISKAGLEPYRIDEDLSVRIPIEDIEKNITESTICFAEITTDNPNVWYELGFAFASRKDVVMICSNEREGKFPFDIQHRNVIKYQTGSKSDFENVEDLITKKLKAYLQKSKTVQTLQSTPVADTEGLSGHEVALLILMMEEQLSSDDYSAIYTLLDSMERAGYTPIAASVGIRTLRKKGMIETFIVQEGYGNGNYSACKITDNGVEWLLNNKQELVFRKEDLSHTSSPDRVDDLPF